jgi:hypothetical protein
MLILRLTGLSIVFFVFWTYWLGDFLTTFGQQAISSQGLVGVEAMVFGNLNLILFVFYAIFLLVSIYIGGTNDA